MVPLLARMNFKLLLPVSASIVFTALNLDGVFHMILMILLLFCIFHYSESPEMIIYEFQGLIVPYFMVCYIAGFCMAIQFLLFESPLANSPLMIIIRVLGALPLDIIMSVVLWAHLNRNLLENRKKDLQRPNIGLGS